LQRPPISFAATQRLRDASGSVTRLQSGYAFRHNCDVQIGAGGATRRLTEQAVGRLIEEAVRREAGKKLLDAMQRLRAETEYRVLYVAKFAEAIYVLHAFTKKTPATSLTDMRVGKQRYCEMLELRKAK